MSGSTPEVLLDLAVPRIICLHDRGRAFTITCRRIEPADWLAFFASITVTSEQRGAERINTSDSISPALQLAERVISDASGYAVEGGVSITSLPNWQTRLPLSHRHRVGSTLANVSRSEPSDCFVIRAEGEEVSIDADWTLDSITGKMMRLTGLKHIFKTPTQAQQKRYYAASSRSVVVGGSRTGRTIYAGAQETLCELYDDLILSVDGYAWKGTPLQQTTDIRNVMDLQHKFVAAEQLFNPPAVTTEAVAE